MKIKSLIEYKDNKIPHMTGEAHCIACHNTWIAVAPTGTEWIQCPKCDMNKGAFMNHVTVPKDTPVWTCNCGNQLWYYTEDGLWCPNCGSYSKIG